VPDPGLADKSDRLRGVGQALISLARTRARGANRQDGGAHPSGERADGSNAGQSHGYGPGAPSSEP